MEEVKRCPMNEFKNCWGHQCRWWVEEQQNCCIVTPVSRKKSKKIVKRSNLSKSDIVIFND